MTQSHLPDSAGGPDWTAIGVILTAIGGLATAVIAAMRGAFRGRQNLQAERDKNVTKNAELTLESVFRLINELQEEVNRKGEELIASERRCGERIQQMETKVDSLLVRIGDLERQLRDRPAVP